jgi:hypothetical protein
VIPPKPKKTSSKNLSGQEERVKEYCKKSLQKYARENIIIGGDPYFLL